MDITSLLDILVIILVFLLKSYNTSGVLFNVPRGISLPQSVSKNSNVPGVVIQISKEKVWVDDELIIERLQADNVTDHDGRRIIVLFDKLVKKRQTIELVNKNSLQQQKGFQGMANLIIDKTVGYGLNKKVLYTAAEAEFKEYKFVVMGEKVPSGT